MSSSLELNLRKPKNITIFLFVFSFVILLFASTLCFNNVNDDWILSGVFPFFVLFVFIYSIAVVCNTNLKIIAILSSCFLAAVILVPYLKYGFILGPFDSMLHYGSITETIGSGHASFVYPYDQAYENTPGLHLLISSLSVVCNLDVSASISLFLTISMAILPLATYVLLTKMALPSDISKYVLIATVISFPCQWSYIFTGLTAIYPLYAFLLYFILILVAVKSQKIGLEYSLFVAIFGFVILFSHDATSFFLIILLSILSLFSFFGDKNKEKSFLKPPRLLLLMLVTAFIAHFIYVSVANFTSLVWIIESSFSNLLRLNDVPTSFYGAFFTLSNSEKASILTVSYIRDFILILLSIFAILLLRSKLRFELSGSKKIYVIMFCIFITLSLSSVFTFLYTSGGTSNRLIIYSLPLTPFLAGLTLAYVNRKKLFIKYKIAFVLLLSALICVSFLQIYPCQPLIPKRSTPYGDYYVREYRMVNTIYHNSVINFVDKYSANLSISSDDLVRSQMHGLMSPPNQNLISNYSMLVNLYSHIVILSLNTTANPAIIYSQASGYENYYRYCMQNRSLTYSNGPSNVFFDY